MILPGPIVAAVLALAPTAPTPAAPVVAFVVLEAKTADGTSVWAARRARVEIFIESAAEEWGVPEVEVRELEVQLRRVVVRGAACPADEAREAITETGGAKLEFTCPAVDAPGSSQATRAAL